MNSTAPSSNTVASAVRPPWVWGNKMHHVASSFPSLLPSFSFSIYNSTRRTSRTGAAAPGRDGSPSLRLRGFCSKSPRMPSLRVLISLLELMEKVCMLTGHQSCPEKVRVDCHCTQVVRKLSRWENYLEREPEENWLDDSDLWSQSLWAYCNHLCGWRKKKMMPLFLSQEIPT